MVDWMLESEVYENNPTKIANDLLVGMFAGTDTSRNATIFCLCHLAKNKVSRDKMRTELEGILNQEDQSNAKRFW